MRALDEIIQKHEATIERMLAEQSKLAPSILPGLSPDQAEALVRFAGEVRQGLALATPTDRRTPCEMLRLRGRVYHNADANMPPAMADRFSAAYQSTGGSIER